MQVRPMLAAFAATRADRTRWKATVTRPGVASFVASSASCRLASRRRAWSSRGCFKRGVVEMETSRDNPSNDPVRHTFQLLYETRLSKRPRTLFVAPRKALPHSDLVHVLRGDSIDALQKSVARGGLQRCHKSWHSMSIGGFRPKLGRHRPRVAEIAETVVQIAPTLINTAPHRIAPQQVGRKHSTCGRSTSNLAETNRSLVGRSRLAPVLPHANQRVFRKSSARICKPMQDAQASSSKKTA